MYKRFFALTVSFLLLNIVILSQTGKITGKVTDSQTGEPLIGANIIVLNTEYGSATGLNGEYTIHNVPPGIYNLRGSFIGYQSVTIQNIRVVSGLTQEVDFPLPSSAIATEEIVIVSERPLIEKSSTNALRIVDSESIESLPTRDLNKIAALQPGVVFQNNLITIRGSRPDETGYMIEGADVKNAVSRDGGSLINLTPDAVQEILIQAGGYNAEFGGANAGIIQSNLKTGKDVYNFSLRAETDNFGNYPGDKFLGTYSYGYTNLVATASGPVITNRVKFFLSLENNFMRDFNPAFFSGNPTAFSDGALFDTTKVYDTGASGGNSNEYQILKWQDGNVPGNFRNRYTFNGTALVDLDPVVLKLSGAFTNQEQRRNSVANIPHIINIFNTERYPLTDNSDLLLSLKGIYFIDKDMFLEGNVSYVDRRTKTYDPFFKDDVLSYNDSLKGAQYGWEYAGLYSAPYPYDFYGFPFNRPGTNLTNYEKSHFSYWGGSLAFTAQLKDHELKAGGSFQYWTTRYYLVTSTGSLLRNIRTNPDLVRTTDQLIAYLQNFNSSNFNNYGYDLFGRVVDDESSPYAPKHPVFASAYVQDKFESDDLIINAGFRFDYIDMDSWALIDPSNPKYDEETKLISKESLTDGRTFQYISPRLGFSFPVTDQTVFHMQYGKFVQAPSLDLSYRGMHQATSQLIGGFAFVNPIAYDLEPVRTTQYEIGITQQFTEFAAVDITAFYKDIKGLPVYAFQEVIAGASVAQYAVYTNQDFATTKGVEVNLKTRRVERVRAEVNYTYTDAKGTNSFAQSGFGSVQVNNNVPTVIVPLDYDQRHRGSIVLDYRFGKDEGGPILEQLGLNVLFTFNSGHPFTFAQMPAGLGQQSPDLGFVIGNDTRQRVPAGPINSTTTPWVYNIDLRIDKSFSAFDVNFNVYLYVENLLNTRNVINVYDHTGNGYDDGFLNSPAAEGVISGARFTERFVDLYNAINLENRQHYLRQKGYDIFDSPRQLRFGVLIDF